MWKLVKFWLPVRRKTVREWLEQIARGIEKMAETQTEVIVRLNLAAEKAAKIADETRSLLTKQTALLEEIANLQNASPELTAAADAVSAQLDIVDELVPDPIVEPPPVV
jgi:arsenate reductase-like glutaredoxin family protein